MATVVTGAVAATVGYIVVFAVEEGVVGSAAGALVAETAVEAQTVVTTLYGPDVATPAPQSAVAEVVFVAALVADVVTVGETVALHVPAAAEFVLGTLDVVIAVVAVALPAVSVVPVDQAALSAVAVELLVPAAVIPVVGVAVVVAGLAWPLE